MQKFYSRFKRGDVWYLHMPTENGDGTASSVQKKSRPYVIVSCEENNNCAPTLNVCPITTRNSDHLPPHVYFRYEDGSEAARNQLVLCEQVTTVGADVFNHPKSYFMYSFDVEFMDKIDEALAAQLGLRVRVADMNILENLINKLAAQKAEDIKQLSAQSLDIRVNDLAARLAKQFGVKLDSTDMLNGLVYNNADLEYAPAEVKEQLTKVAAERTAPKATVAPLKKTPMDEAPPKAAVSKKATKNRWTPEVMQTFVEDYKKLSISAMSAKYNLTKKSIQQMAWKFRKQLAETK